MSSPKNIYKIIAHKDYDITVKLDKTKIKAFSKKALDKIYPDENYVILGDSKLKTKKDIIGTLSGYNKDNVLKVLNINKLNRFFYRKAGYVLVDGEKHQYISLIKFRFMPILLLFFAVAVVGVILTLLFSPSSPDTPALPVVILPNDDKNAVPIASEEDYTNTDGSDSGGGKVGLIYTTNAKLNLSTGQIGIYFANPSESTQNLVIEVHVKNGEDKVLIGESGLIRAGNGLNIIDFKENAILSSGNYSGVYTIIAYDIKTNKRSMVEVEIPITISVEA